MKIEYKKMREVVEYLDSIDERGLQGDEWMIKDILSAAQKMYFRLLPRKKKEKIKKYGKIGGVLSQMYDR